MTTTSIPELEPTRKPEPEVKRPRKPEPELKQPKKPQPEIKQPITPAKPEVGEDQGDSGPDRENPITEQSKHSSPVDREDAHIGATESQVSDTTAPSGDAFEDEPRQG
jgi:hypothetical protein